MLVLLISTTAGRSVLAQPPQTGDGLPVGVPVTYESADGSESLTLTVEEVIDPYQNGLTAYDQDRLASETKRYVGVRLTIDNDAPELYSYFSPWSISLLDADTVMYEQTSVQRDVAADPGLPAGEITAGGSISGLLLYELPLASEVERIQFAPSPDRLITLSSHGGQPDAAASATGEPTTAATVAPTAIQPDAAAPATEEPSAADVEAPTAIQPDLTDLDSRGSYDSAYLGHRVHWDPAYWRAVRAYGQPDHDHLSLEGHVFTISIDGMRDLDGDAKRCLVEQVHGDLDEIAGFDAPSDDVQPPTEDGRLPADGGLYLMTTDEDGYPREMVRYVECRPLLAGKAVLRIIITAPSRYWAIDRGLAAEVLSAIQMPVWSPESGTAVSPTEPSLPPEAETPEVPALGCGALLTLDDADLVLAALERHHAGLDGDLLSLAGGEVCTMKIASDEAVFVRIEPGRRDDFEPDARMLGAEGRPIPAFGDDALVFHADSSDAEGQSVLVVGERRDVGTLHVRLTLGRPDLEAPERTLLLARLARDVLPRFPGSRMQSRLTSLTDGLSLGAVADVDRSHLTYVDNLQVKEAAGEWTRGEGLIATLRMLAGEAAPEEVLRHGTSLDWEATGILSMAARYLEDGTGDTEERAEIGRLLDHLTWDNEELEAMAGITPAAPSTALRGASIGVVGQPRSVGFAVSSPPLARRQPAVRTAQAGAADCIEFFDEEVWNREVTGIGPCLEWSSVDVPGQAADKYRIFIPAAPLPQAGWSETDFLEASQAIQLSAMWFEDEGNRLARAVGAPGRMPPVNVVFGTKDTGDLADAWPVEREACGVRLLPTMQGLSSIAFHQTIAHEFAHCHQMENFPDQFRLANSDWWWEGSADYLSNVIYPTGNFEWESWSYAEGFSLDTTLLDLSYGAFVFFQFLEWEIGTQGIFGLIKGLPIKGGKREQEASLRQTHGAMDELFHDFVEALIDGKVRDTGGGYVPTPMKVAQVVLAAPADITGEIKPFGVGRQQLLVEECKRARLQLGKAAIKSSARPQADSAWLDGWATQATSIPLSKGDEHDRIFVATAVVASQVALAIPEVDDDPECEPDDPLASSDALDAWCELPCEPSAFFPPLSDPVDIGDS